MSNSLDDSAKSNSPQSSLRYTKYSGPEEGGDLLKGFRVEKRKVIVDLVEENTSLKSQLFQKLSILFQTPVTDSTVR